MSNNKTTSDSSLVAVGVDIGSHNARVCISQNSTSTTPYYSTSIVPNEIGQRYTLAISVAEPEIESDPMNDQYWDDIGGNKKQKDVSLSAAKQKKKNVHYLHGDAARKSLQRLKKPIEPHCILNMIKTLQDQQQQQQQQQQQEDNVQEEIDNDSNQDACVSFFQHLANLTAHASHTSPQHLRFVLSVPPNDTGISLASDLSLYFHKGILESIQQAGGYSKSEKKMIYGQKRILSVITHPVAIAHAHGLLDNELKQKQNVLIVDWGASAMSVSHLVIVGGIVRIVNHVWDDSLSGKHIISMLVKHIAELFERKNRCIPPGEVLCNKKARAKLEIAAEEAIRSLGFSSKVTVTIDGLYEGLDCHVDVMLATFEMLMKSILTRSEVMWKGFQEEGENDGTDDDVKKYDAVIGAGSVMNIKCVERMMDRIFPREIFYRGKSVNDVPPEEAVAMGCAVYGACCLSTGFLDDMQGDEKSNNPEDTVQQWSLVDEEVPLCPISIGLRLVEGNPAAILLIEEGMPLPCLVTKMISVSECTSKYIDIVQITSPSSEKTIGRIQGVEGDDENKQLLEITVEVDESGMLSFAVNSLVTVWDELGSSTAPCSE